MLVSPQTYKLFSAAPDLLSAAKRVVASAKLLKAEQRVVLGGIADLEAAVRKAAEPEHPPLSEEVRQTVDAAFFPRQEDE